MNNSPNDWFAQKLIRLKCVSILGVNESGNASFPFQTQEGEEKYIYGDRFDVIPNELPVLEFVYGFVDTRIPDNYNG